MKYYETLFTIAAPDDLMQDSRDLLAAMAGDAGYETFEETENGLKGYIQQDLYSEDALRDIIADFPFDGVFIDYKTAEADYRDWNEQWENEGFEPIYITDNCVVHDGRHLPEKSCDVQVEIDAKLAFGTGTHETTKMVARQLLALDLKGKRILDCGCGTGILGIIALKYGANKVVGYDIDEWSADNARHNAVINYVGDQYDARLGDVSVLENTSDRFDVIVANINRNILLADMPSWHRLTAPHSTLILSGFYTTDIGILVENASSLGMTLRTQTNDGDWACLVFSRK